MRSRFDLDPSQDYGEPTPAIRRIVEAWTAVDWFAPGRESDAGFRARRCFDEHHRLARTHLPEAFGERIAVWTQLGGWEEFVSLCERVRSPSSRWDWKYAALKPLCHAHSQAKGWRLEDQKPYARTVENQATPGGALFLHFGAQVMWAFNPPLDLEAALGKRPARDLEAARWYLGYAHMDVTHALEWQLAEQSARVEGNPFVPLLGCYAAGFFPFSLARDELILFAFE